MSAPRVTGGSGVRLSFYSTNGDSRIRQVRDQRFVCGAERGEPHETADESVCPPAWSAAEVDIGEGRLGVQAGRHEALELGQRLGRDALGPAPDVRPAERVGRRGRATEARSAATCSSNQLLSAASDSRESRRVRSATTTTWKAAAAARHPVHAAVTAMARVLGRAADHPGSTTTWTESAAPVQPSHACVQAIAELSSRALLARDA